MCWWQRLLFRHLRHCKFTHRLWHGSGHAWCCLTLRAGAAYTLQTLPSQGCGVTPLPIMSGWHGSFGWWLTLLSGKGQQWALEHVAEGVSCGFPGVTHGMPVGGTGTWALILLGSVVFIFVKWLKHVSKWRERMCVLPSFLLWSRKIWWHQSLET